MLHGLIRSTPLARRSGSAPSPRLRFWSRSVEPIEMHARRFFYQPLCFRWRGLVYRVYRLEEVWEEQSRSYRGARRYFRVSCGNARQYTLFHDLRVNTWHLVYPVE